jgi:hypothetical protein
VIFFTTLVLMLSQTAYFSQNRYANMARWTLLAGLSALNLVRPKQKLPLRKLLIVDVVAVVFLGYAMASAAYSVSPSLTVLRAASGILLYIAVFWTIWHFADAAGEDRVTDILIAAACVVLLAGVVISTVPSLAGADVSEAAWSGGRFRGIMANPNAIGMMGILFLPLLLSRYMRRSRTLDLVILILIAGSVVLSGSRNGVLAASISTLYLLLRARAWKAGIAIAALTAILYLAMTSYISFKDVAVTRGIARLAESDSLKTGGGRIEAWNVAIPIIKQEPVFGHGFGTEELIFRGKRFRRHVGAYVHNSYLGLAYQLGLLGVALLFVPLIGLFISRQFARGTVPVRTVGYEAMLLGGIAASFLESWIYSVGNAFAFPFWICVMLLLRASQFRAPQKASDQLSQTHTRHRAARPPIGMRSPPRQPAIPRFDPPPPDSSVSTRAN